MAKCLDARILRNVEYLNWCEEKRDAFRSGNLITPALDSGVKCIVRWGMKEHTGFVQSIDRKADSAEVSSSIERTRLVIVAESWKSAEEWWH